jgi:hypothetical protein
MKFNINSTVKVRLTDHGRQVHKEMWLMAFSGLNWPYKPPIEDEEGYSSWRLWILMKMFGSEFKLGAKPCFEDEIEIPDTEVKS